MLLAAAANAGSLPKLEPQKTQTRFIAETMIRAGRLVEPKSPHGQDAPPVRGIAPLAGRVRVFARS